MGKNIRAVCQMVSNGYHILRRIFFPILRHKYIFYACIMFGNSVLVDKFQGINNILLFQLWYSHAAPPQKCVHTLYHKERSVFNMIPETYRLKMKLFCEYKLIFSGDNYFTIFTTLTLQS